MGMIKYPTQVIRRTYQLPKALSDFFNTDNALGYRSDSEHKQGWFSMGSISRLNVPRVHLRLLAKGKVGRSNEELAVR